MVLGHNILTVRHPVLSRGIFSFHMPLFFILAGVFLKASVPLGKLVSVRADTLLKPFFGVLLVTGGLRALVGFLQGQPFDREVALLNPLWATSVTLIWPPLWFLPHLFLSSLAAWCVLRACHRRGRVGVAVVACLLLLMGGWFIGAAWSPQSPFSGSVLASIRQGHVPGWPWSLDLLPISVALLLLGHLGAKRILNFEFSVFSLCVSAGVFSLCHVLYQGTLDLADRHLDEPWVALIKAGSGVVLTLSVAAWCTQALPLGTRVMAQWGQASLFILLFHGPLQSRVYLALERWFGASEGAALVAWIVAMALPWVFWRLAHRHAWLSTCLLPASHSVQGTDAARRA